MNSKNLKNKSPQNNQPYNADKIKGTGKTKDCRITNQPNNANTWEPGRMSSTVLLTRSKFLLKQQNF